MDRLGGHYAKLNKSEKDKYCMHHLYVESKKYNKLVSITKRSRLTDKDNKLVVTNGRAVNIGIRD